MAGGSYYYKWSCSKCSYNERILHGPLRIEPQTNVPRSKLEFRWCNSCCGIRKCFTGIGHVYKPGDNPNSKAKYWKYSSLEKIQFEISEILENINLLEVEKKSNIFFLFSSKSKELSNLRAKLSELEKDLIDYKDSLTDCRRLSEHTFNYYNQLKSVAKCLTCASENVSSIEWVSDKHSCGGEFVKEDLGRFGTVNECKKIQYDQFGNSIHSVEKI